MEGEREIINLGTNSYLNITAYYVNDWDVYDSKQFKISPSYLNSDSQSAIQFNISTYSNEFNYKTYDSKDIYKLVVDGISVEYSCQK